MNNLQTKNRTAGRVLWGLPIFAKLNLLLIILALATPVHSACPVSKPRTQQKCSNHMDDLMWPPDCSEGCATQANVSTCLTNELTAEGCSACNQFVSNYVAASAQAKIQRPVCKDENKIDIDKTPQKLDTQPKEMPIPK